MLNLQKEDLPKFECSIYFYKLTQILDIVKNTSFDSFCIHVTEKGFELNQMDSSHVSLIVGRLDVKSFEDYSVQINGSFVISAAELRNTLKIFTKKDILNISCDIEPKITFSAKDITLEYKLFNLYSHETFKAPKLYYDTEFDILQKSKLYDTLSKVAKAHDYIILHVINPSKNMPSRLGFILKNDGDKKSLQRVTFSTPTEFYHLPDYSYKVAFHLEYLLEFIKNLPKEKLFFRMAKGMPLLITAKLDENSSIDYWLAPRIMDNPKEYE